MSTPRAYDNFDLIFVRSAEGFCAYVTSTRGQPSVPFKIPFTPEQLRTLAEHAPGQQRGELNGELRGNGPGAERDLRAAGAGPDLTFRQFGKQLYDVVFTNYVNLALLRSLDKARDGGHGVRIRLHFDQTVSDLAELPWEYLYADGRFLAQDDSTPIVRFLRRNTVWSDVNELHWTKPLVVLVVVSDPSDLPHLQVEEEYRKLSEAVKSLEADGLMRLERLEEPTIEALTKRLADLRQGQVHVLHFIGHGHFGQEVGSLAFEKKNGRSEEVSGDRLVAVIHAHQHLRLAFLNSCRGAQAGRDDVFQGIAQHLVQCGVPMVVAMQYPISDEAATTLTASFYRSLAQRRPVDAALSAARCAISPLESGTPVLYMSADDGSLFPPCSVKSAVRAALLAVQRLAKRLAIFLRRVLKGLRQRLWLIALLVFMILTLWYFPAVRSALNALLPARTAVASPTTSPAATGAGLVGLVLDKGTATLTLTPTASLTATPTSTYTLNLTPTSAPSDGAAIGANFTPPATPAPTETQAPPPTPTATPTATATWTRTPRPTAAPEPTSTPTVPTRTPARPRPTATRTATPPAMVAPILLAPPNGTSVGASDEVSFVWQWRGRALAPNEAFEVRIWKDGQEHLGATGATRETSARFSPLSARNVLDGGDGTYYWTVAVIVTSGYQKVGPEAEPRRIMISGVRIDPTVQPKETIPP